MSKNEKIANPSDLTALIAKCDDFIRQGNTNQAAALVVKLNLAQIPRKYCFPMAQVFRRIGLINKGLKLLYPIIRAEKSVLQPATTEEICEYAVLVSRLGSVDEAIELLNTIDANTYPEALLNEAFCHISQWNYWRAAEILEQYKNVAQSPYAKLVAQVNLASSYLVTAESAFARSFLVQTIEMAKEAKAQRLLGNCFVMAAQIEFFAQDYSAATEKLDAAAKIFEQNHNYDQLLLFKWTSALKSFTEKNPDHLMTFRKIAESRGHFESVRETDFLLLLLNFDQRLFDYLMIGTPSIHYHKRILNKISGVVSDHVVFGGSGQHLVQPSSDLFASKPAEKVLRVIYALTRDFYKPRSMGSLHSELYPGEYFNIYSSPTRIAQLMRRTRRWLEAHQIDLKVDCSDNGYKIDAKGNYGIEIPKERTSIEHRDHLFGELQKYLQEKTTLNAKEACQKLGMSRTSFLRLANWGLDNGKLEKNGVGKATQYLLKVS